LGVEKISIVSNNSGAPGKWLEQLNQWSIPDLRWTLGDRARLYGLPRAVTKMTGVRSWQQRMGMGEVDLGIIGFGNDRNDFELLLEADVAVVVNSSGEATQGLLDDLRGEKITGEVMQVETNDLLELARRIGR
jgi:hydroxymethylpyrimidine pyrophosphatase-like HAD family hydrolase